MNRKFTSTVAGATLIIALAAVLSRSIGFLREMIYANVFGLNKSFDIYLVGAVFPTIINTAVYYLAQNYFISSYHKIPVEQSSERKIFFNKNFIVFILIGFAITIVLFLLRGFIMETYLWRADETTRDITEKIFLLFILSIPLNAGYSIIASYLQAENVFNKPAIAQIFLNIPIILLVLFFNKSLGIYSIGIGYLFGNLFQIVYLFYFVKDKITFNFSNIVNRLSVKEGLNASLIIIILIEVVNQLHLVIDRYFFNFVDEGGIASLNYASVLFVLPIGVFSIALSTAIFPRLAESFNKKDWTKLEKYFNDSLAVLTFLFVPLTFIFFFQGDLIIRLLFQHGEFSIVDTVVTYKVLQMYSISLLFYSAYAVINKLVYSSGLIKQQLAISILLLLVKIIFNFILVKILKQDGLALSSSITYIILSLSCLVLVLRKMNIKNKYRFINEVLFAIVMASIAYFISNNLVRLFTIDISIQQILTISVFCLNYFFLSYFTGTLPKIAGKF